MNLTEVACNFLKIIRAPCEQNSELPCSIIQKFLDDLSVGGISDRYKFLKALLLLQLIVTGWTVWDRIPVGNRFSAPVQTDPGGPSSRLYNGQRVSLPGVKWPGRGANHPRHLVPRLKKEQNYTSTPLLGPYDLYVIRKNLPLHFLTYTPLIEAQVNQVVSHLQCYVIQLCTHVNPLSECHTTAHLSFLLSPKRIWKCTNQNFTRIAQSLQRLATGQKVRGSNPGGGWFSAPVYMMGTGSFPGVKRPGRGFDHPPPSSAEVEGRVELHICSPSGPSWLVLG